MGSKDLRSYSTNLQAQDDDEDKDMRLKGRMGDRMVSMGLISEDQLNVAIQEKKISGKMLGEILVDLGFISEDQLTSFLADSSGFDLFDPKLTIVDGEALALPAAQL